MSHSNITQSIIDPVHTPSNIFVHQDAGSKKRGLLFGARHYPGRRFRPLSVSPANDVKDVTQILSIGGFGLANVYEDVPSADHFESVLAAYVEAVNKEPEEIGDESDD